ncbi:MAG: NADH-quinone oxidoreductase subunit M [candidate division WOR-3 bacterium]
MKEILIYSIPLLGAITLFFLKEEKRDLIFNLSLLFSIIPLLFSGFYLFYFFKNPLKEFYLIEFKISFLDLVFKIDSFSSFLIFLNNLLFSLSIYFSKGDILFRIKELNVWLLFTQTSLNFLFSSDSLLPFFIFWEFSIIPFYFLIGIWGGERKKIANLKFVFYTLLSGAFLLTGIIGVKLKFFDSKSSIGFLLFLISFSIKIPLFPFHTWLPDAHTEAPTAGSVILAGVLLKMGTWGFYKFLIPLFPHAFLNFKNIIIFLSIFSIFYGALMSFTQEDLKRLVAYSSVSHMGFVILGLSMQNVSGIQGAFLQMFNHGIVTGALFILVGILYKRTYTRKLSDFGGISKTIPLFSFYFVLFFLSTIGLPGTSNFVGEFLLIYSSFKNNLAYGIILSFAPFFSALYALKAVKKTLWGKIKKEELKHLPDLDLKERKILLLLTIFVFLLGIIPSPFLYILHRW